MLLKELVALLLEKGRDERWEENQAAIRSKLDKTIAKKEWVEQQIRNRLAYEELVADLTKTYKVKKKAETEAKEQQRSRPEKYLYDPNNSKQTTLDKAVNDMRAAMRVAVDAGIIDERIPDEFYEDSNEKKDDRDPAVLPDKNAKPIIGVEALKPFEFYEWKNDLWWKKIKAVKHGFTGASAGQAADERPEPGEARLAKILGGAQQGSSVGYDIVTLTADNELKQVSDKKSRVIATTNSAGTQQRWEVKGIGGFKGNASMEVRPGGKGIAAGDEQIKTLQDILMRIKDFLNAIQDYGFAAMRSSDGKITKVYALFLGSRGEMDSMTMDRQEFELIKQQNRAYKLATDYVNANMGWFTKGEISDERINMMYTILQNLQEKICKPWLAAANAAGEVSSIKVAGKEMPLRHSDTWTSVEEELRADAEYEYDVAKDNGLLQPEELFNDFLDRYLNGPQGLMRIDINIARRLICRILNGRVFKKLSDIKALIKDVEEKLPIAEIFHGVDGIFLVSNKGFLLIPIKRVSEAFELNRYSMRKPFLKIKPEILQLMQFAETAD